LEHGTCLTDILTFSSDRLDYLGPNSAAREPANSINCIYTLPAVLCVHTHNTAMILGLQEMFERYLKYQIGKLKSMPYFTLFRHGFFTPCNCSEQFVSSVTQNSLYLRHFCSSSHEIKSYSHNTISYSREGKGMLLDL
jgi:hypothetical protein